MLQNSVTAPDYAHARPFPFTYLDGLEFLPEEELLAASRRCNHVAELFAGSDVTYDNPLEKKRVVNFSRSALTGILDRLTSDEWISFVEQMTGLKGLEFDHAMWGSGLSVVDPGGYLALHKDLEVHPQTGKKRAVNLALFLNEEWQDEWGGHLEFWSDCGGLPKALGRKLRPKFGRIVLFDPQGWHGFPDPIQSPCSRISLQLFYYLPEKTTGRSKAFFAPRTREEGAQMLNDFRDLARKHT